MLPCGKRAGSQDCNGGQSKRQRKLENADGESINILGDNDMPKICHKDAAHVAASQKLSRKAPAYAPTASASATADKTGKLTILLCYLYKQIDDTIQLQKWFQDHCSSDGITGRVLVSIEGINVNLAGSPGAIDRLCSDMDSHPVIGGGVIDYKLDDTDLNSPFPDLAVKLSKEVVATGGSMSFELLNKSGAGGGKHLSPSAFHAVLESYNRAGADNSNTNISSSCEPVKPLVLVDVRNRKEIEFGTFEGAVSSDTKIFSEWTRLFALPRIEELKKKKVLMFCTGGVRCEKASAFLKHKVGVAVAGGWPLVDFVIIAWHETLVGVLSTCNNATHIHLHP